MGNVAISIKIMPDSPERNLEKLKSDINKIVKIQDYKIEPIAFGLKCLKIMVIVSDKQGTENIEKRLKNIKGVGEVEIESSTLI